MAWSRKYTRTSEVQPYDSVLFCGICGIEVHVTRAGVLPAHVVCVRDDLLHLSPTHDIGAEEACAEHLSAEHPLRYQLWKRLGWRWLIGGLR